jgi:hypothetical protein
MSIPALVAKDATKAAWVMTVTTPKPSAPSLFDIRMFAAKVAIAAIAIPTTFCDVPERMLR